MVEQRVRLTILSWIRAALLLWLSTSCTGYVEDPGAGATRPSGASTCGDLLSSAVNCGRCGRACGVDQICDLGVCKAMSQGCSGGRLLCGGGCVDAQTSASHCGTCDNACGDNRTCSAGSCVCAGSAATCGSDCANLQTDVNHCGTCNNACTNGRSCEGGTCVCPTGRMLCGDVCTDTQTSIEHCGSCNAACAVGQVCAAGNCACPTGQQVCGSTCVDTLENDAHCGGCDQRCALGQTCAAGMCGGGGLGEDACSGLAQNLTVEQVAVYQGVKVTVMDNNAAIAVAERNTDVVADREAMFRVFVTLGAGFSARELSARIFVENGDVVDSYFAKQNISASSTDASTANSFQIVVPRDKITTETRYAVEIVECGTGSGGMQSPRFPAMDGTPLGARETGVLKIEIVPVQANGQGPDTSSAGLQAYRELMLAMYPITDLELTVGDELNTGYPIQWENLLDAVRDRRQSDGAPDDVYYYGLLRPTATLQQFCGGGCTAGIGFVPGSGGNGAANRAAVGIGFGDETSAKTMVHEVGHNHGRNHAPCVQGGSIAGVDQNYPYDGATLGVWGYDSRDQSFIDPDEATDIMSYCNDQWLSDYTYDGLLNRIAQVNGALQVYVPPEQLQLFRVMLVTARGPSWGRTTTRPSLPAGEPEAAEVLDTSGSVLDTIEVYRTEISDLGSYSIEVPMPKPGWHAVKVRGATALPF